MINSLEKEFFDFVYERQLIWYKRFIFKEKAPWTDDAVLAKYKIINVYRELDKCTLYIINKLKGIKDREKILANIIFYRFFNQFNLYEKLGIEPFEKIDNELKKLLIGKFEKLKDKGSIFNNAYLISGVKGEKKHISILNNLGNINLRKVVDELDSAKTIDDSLLILKKIPMVGNFLACEIWTDLSYFGFFKQKWDDNDIVYIGPGAVWGLEIIYGKKLNKRKQEQKLKHLHEIQKEFLGAEWKKIAYENAFSNYPYLSLTNIESSLCEFRKYWNIKHGKGRRKYFAPNPKN